MVHMRKLIGTVALAALLTACGGSETPVSDTTPTPTETPETPETPIETTTPAADPLEAAITGSWRSEANQARDIFRHPQETLEFLGVEPDDTIIEIWPGGGWYTEILAPFVKDEGKYIAAGVDTSSAFGQRAFEAFETNFLSRPDLFGEIDFTVIGRGSEPMVETGTADAVLTFRNIHNWMAGGYTEHMFETMYGALKPGGTLGVVEHRLGSSDTQDPRASNGYVHEDYVKQVAEAAGFVFVESSEVNANPRDTKDHPGGVWNLPPNLRTTDANGDDIVDYDPTQFTSIGESDRMTLKFIKPLEEPEADVEAETEE